MNASVNLAHLSEPQGGSLSESLTKERKQEAVQNALMAVNTLHETSKKLLQKASLASAEVANGLLEAARAIWDLIMGILRFLARIFGQKQAPAQARTDAALPDAPSPAFVASGANSTDIPAAQAEKGAEVASLVDASAHQLKETVAAAGRTNTPEAHAFLNAMSFAGLDEANTVLLQHAQSPDVFAKSRGPNEMLTAVLDSAVSVVANLDEKVLLAQSVLAQAAAKISGNFKNPILVEDLVRMLRGHADTGKEFATDPAAATSLIQADDALRIVAGHREMVTSTLAMIVAAAKNSGVKLTEHDTTLQKVFGPSWVDKITEMEGSMADTALEAQTTANSAASPQYLEPEANDEAKDKAAAFIDSLQIKPAAAVLTVVESVNSVVKLSAADRLRAASLQALKLFPDDPSFDHPIDDEQRPTPTA